MIISYHLGSGTHILVGSFVCVFILACGTFDIECSSAFMLDFFSFFGGGVPLLIAFKLCLMLEHQRRYNKNIIQKLDEDDETK